MESRSGLPKNIVLADSYRILRQIGGGGFGITYAAEDIRLTTTVAIKEYYPEAFGDRDAKMSVRPKSERHKSTFEWGRVSFLQEARTLARFQHPSVVRVSRIFEANSTAYMVMDFERGENFESWLKRLDGAPSQGELDRIVVPLLDALEIMHAEKFLHRDIAPDNIIIRPDGTPVLLDFGAARRAVAERSHALTGIVKAGYSPNEQYASDSRLQGPWSDIYALGGTLYRAVAGVAPEEATLRVADDRLVRAIDIGRGTYRRDFLAAIDACLRVRLSERPQSIAVLRPMLVGTQKSVARLGRTLRSPSGTLPQAWGTIAAGAVILLGVGHGLLDYTRRHNERDAKEQREAAAARAKSEQERLARQEAEARRRREEHAAAEQRTPPHRELDPSAPFAEYFKDLPRPSSTPPATVLPSVVIPRPANGRGWIGIKMQSVNEDIAERSGARENRGALVAAVTEGSPAAKAGLQDCDIILRFDGKEIRAMRDLPQIIRGTAIGRTVPIEVWRSDRLVTLQAKIGQSSQGDVSAGRSRRRRR